MFTKFSIHKYALGVLAVLTFILAACAPLLPQTGADPTRSPSGVTSGLDAGDILVQLDYEPGFMLPEYRYDFGRTPYFTLLADGTVIYVDQNQDGKVMQAQLSQEEAAALLQQIRDLGFADLESHTDMCGVSADGVETCIADMSTSVLRVRMADGSLREIKNYANFSNDPAAYEAIYSLLNDFSSPEATVYQPHAATLFVRIVSPPEDASPANWPLDPAYIQRAQSAPEQFTAVVLSAEEAAVWQQTVGIDNRGVTFQLDGQPVMGMFVPWLPGQDYAQQIAAEFPQ